MTFTPDNRALTAGTADGVVTWDFHADRGRPLPGEGVNSVEFAPTGAYVLSWGAADLALWRTDNPAPADGGPRRPLITFPVETPAADTQGRLTLWDAGGQRRIVVLAVADSTVERPAPAFSADGSLLAASRDDGSVRVWETASPRREGATLSAGDGPVLAIGFSPGAGELHIAAGHLPLRAAQLTPDRAAADVCARAGAGRPGPSGAGICPTCPTGGRVEGGRRCRP
ncbi:WD40 repeat domain-containing protein [Streptomyces mirabilis]|uniref:WD40 repeat domain-containing protein n=1 Tax=Streptomyces mirabilis TaxID=68239 RepID=UPI0036A4EC61